MDGGEGLMYVAATCYIWCTLGWTVWCTVFCVQRGRLGDARGVWHGWHTVSIPHTVAGLKKKCMWKQQGATQPE